MDVLGRVVVWVTGFFVDSGRVCVWNFRVFFFVWRREGFVVSVEGIAFFVIWSRRRLLEIDGRVRVLV